jgi:spore germination protein GerM
MSAMAKKKSRRPRRGALLIVLLAALAVLVVLFFIGGGGEKIRKAAAPEPAASPAGAGGPGGTRAVTLYFISEGDGLLHAEEREIEAGGAPADEIRRLVEELIKGSTRDLVAPLPAETKIRQVFVARDTAYVDFSREIMEQFAYGSSSELAAVYAVVNTITANFRDVKRVAILVEGGEKETLGGHVDLSRPLVPQPSLIAK